MGSLPITQDEMESLKWIKKPLYSECITNLWDELLQDVAIKPIAEQDSELSFNQV